MNNPTKSTEILQFGPSGRAVEIDGIAKVAVDNEFTLESGLKVKNIPVAYQAYGTLADDKSNVVLVCHALTGDQYVASKHPVTGKEGWWSNIVGSGKAIDTDKFFVICINVMGSCMGSWGPKSQMIDSDEHYSLNFPVITIKDMVRAQNLLLEQLEIETLYAVIGGSMGGMQVLEWAATYPKKVERAVAIATAAKHSAQNIAFHEIGRQAIMADPNWCGGDYIAEGKYPAKGLAVARMTAHVTYLSEVALQSKFGRELQDKEKFSFAFDADFQVESYLRYQGASFVERFDANSYLYITRAMDYFDLSASHNAPLSEIFFGTQTSFCVISFSSDWLYSTDESRHIVRSLSGAGADVSFSDIKTDKGHDAFLLDIAEFDDILRGFLEKPKMDYTDYEI